MTGDGSPAGGPISLRKEQRDEPPRERRGPAWIVIPAHVIALIVVVPLRLVHDLVVAVARGVRAVWDALMRAPGKLGRLVGRMLRGVWDALYRWLLAPAGRLLAAIGRGIGALLVLLVVRPLRWVGVVLVLGTLTWLGRGTASLARWVYRVLLTPIGRFLAMAGRGLAWSLDLLLVRPLRALGRGLAWLAAHGLLRPLRALGRGLLWLLTFSGQALALLFNVLVAVPAVFVWRYVLRPPLLGLAWSARVLWDGLTWLGRGTLLVLGALGAVLAAGWRAFASGVAWSWNLVGRSLAWLARTLIVAPARMVWRYALSPIAAGLAGAWRLTGRALGWFWRTLVVLPVRVVVIGPARAVGRGVLRPMGRGIRGAWRASVREPLRAARRTMRETARDVRLQLRRTFRGK
ncbi:hypothetical protein E1281_13630 [Actinomadura sp. KC345]|uniref:hypothetical protein n=1 Tax=Actinomadura sp. KC345 TaxID=2530371 RepID=UPI001053DEE8|nr:hypothetical protein [Actinomadura sp. KC345]TDC55205.1 hypothetical protein E1281_13630 [Actinomadura sp. KC345]